MPYKRKLFYAFNGNMSANSCYQSWPDVCIIKVTFSKVSLEITKAT